MNIRIVWDALFKKTDVRRSAELVEALAELETKIPSMLSEYRTLDLAAQEIAMKFNAAKACASPEALTLHQELMTVCQKRDGIRFAHGQEREQLVRQLEGLTLPVLNTFRQQCLAWLKEIDAARRVEAVEQIFDGRKDHWVSVVQNNSAIVAQARQFVLAAMREITGLRLKPLAEIQARVEQLESQYSSFNLDQFTTDQVSRELPSDLRASEPSALRQDSAQLVPGWTKSGGGYVVQPIGGPRD